jgi:hypothetical protein
MLVHLDAWDRTADRRRADRRVARDARPEVERRIDERRELMQDTREWRRGSDEPESLETVETEQADANDTKPHQPPGPVARAGIAESPLVIIARTS